MYIGFVHVRKSQIQRLFKDIQGHVSVSNSFVRYEHARSIQCQTISENIQKLKQEKFKDFTNPRTFKALKFCFQIQGHSSFVRTLCK